MFLIYLFNLVFPISRWAEATPACVPADDPTIEVVSRWCTGDNIVDFRALQGSTPSLTNHQDKELVYRTRTPFAQITMPHRPFAPLTAPLTVYASVATIHFPALHVVAGRRHQGEIVMHFQSEPSDLNEEPFHLLASFHIGDEHFRYPPFEESFGFRRIPSMDQTVYLPETSFFKDLEPRLRLSMFLTYPSPTAECTSKVSRLVWAHPVLPGVLNSFLLDYLAVFGRSTHKLAPAQNVPLVYRDFDKKCTAHYTGFAWAYLPIFGVSLCIFGLWWSMYRRQDFIKETKEPSAH